MNKIHNPLGCPGSLNIADIRWMPQRKNGRKRNVPVITRCDNTRAIEIWKRYFELLFLHFNLFDKITKKKKNIEDNASELFSFLFPDKSTLDKNKLLELLTGNPAVLKKSIKIDSENGKEIVKQIFNYKYLISKYREEFTAFILLLNVNVCPYCGRSFTTTVIEKKESYVRTCQVDHFYPQAIYPWLALSIWNMIPSCGFCNHQKGDKLIPILYPYKEETGDMYRFTTHPVNDISYLVGGRDSEEDFMVSLEPAIPPADPADLSDYEKRIENEIDLFKINELYSTHNNYVSCIFRQRYIFGKPYIDSLISSFGNIFRTQEDVRATLYLKSIDSNSIGSNPLDKLTRDIDHEIDMLE